MGNATVLCDLTTCVLCSNKQTTGRDVFNERPTLDQAKMVRLVSQACPNWSAFRLPRRRLRRALQQWSCTPPWATSHSNSLAKSKLEFHVSTCFASACAKNVDVKNQL